MKRIDIENIDIRNIDIEEEPYVLVYNERDWEGGLLNEMTLKTKSAIKNIRKSYYGFIVQFLKAIYKNRVKRAEEVYK